MSFKLTRPWAGVDRHRTRNRPFAKRRRLSVETLEQRLVLSQVIDLNGPWEYGYAATDTPAPAPETNWSQLTVPSVVPWQSNPYVWFRREFDLPSPEFPTDHAYLDFRQPIVAEHRYHEERDVNENKYRQ